MHIYDIWVDFVNLRSETYVENSRIPTMVSPSFFFTQLLVCYIECLYHEMMVFTLVYITHDMLLEN